MVRRSSMRFTTRRGQPGRCRWSVSNNSKDGMHSHSCRYSIFAEELTQRPIAECAAAFVEADAWFSAWQGGDVQPDEMLIIADQVQTTRVQPAVQPGSQLMHTAYAPWWRHRGV